MDSKYSREELQRSFSNSIVRVNIKSGEGFCRIQELWDSEGFTDRACEMPGQVESVALPKASGL